MKDIDKILKDSCTQEFDIPSKIEYRINYTLNNLEKNTNFNFYLKKVCTSLLSIFIVLLSGMTVYSAFGGTINGKNIFEWLGINFSNEMYEKYKEDIDKTISRNETNVTLKSTLCDEGFTILEFDVILSENDKNYLNIGENVVPDDYIENDEYEAVIPTAYDAPILTKKEVKKQIAEDNKDKFIDKIWLSINNDIKIFEDGYIYIEAPHSNMNIILNDNKIFARHNTTQIVNKISDYEYKIYQIYFLSDEKINNQEEFEITIKDLAIGTEYIKVGGGQKNILVPGEFKVKLSKNKMIDDTHIIYPNIAPINYNNSTQTVQKVSITPMQTIIKISAEIKNTNSKNLENYISPLSYKVFDENKNLLTSNKIETNKELVYSNGKIEKLPVEDILYRDFSNATIRFEEYVIIENNADKITIEAYENNNSIGIFNINLK